VKVARLSLPAYGSFSGANIDLDRRRRVHVIYGANEAGKTTRRNALCDLLFGFPKSTPYAFKHDMAHLRVGAVLDIDGVLHVLQRRKGNKDTLRDGAGDLIAESTLVGWLGGISRDLFESRFSIGRAELDGGAHMLSDAQGDVATSIYGAALAGVDPQAIIDALENEAHKIFLPRGKNQALNAAINEFAEKKKLLATSITRPDEWQVLSRQRDENVADLDGSRKRIATFQGDRERYKSICKALESYEGIKALRDELTVERAAGTVLDPETLRRLVDTRDNIARVEVLLRDHHIELSENLAHEDEEPARPELLVKKTDINEIREGLSAVTKALADIPRLRLQEKERDHRDDFERRCRSVWPGISEEKALEWRPSVPDILLVQNLATEGQGIRTELGTARGLASGAQEQLLACDQEAELQGTASDASELDALLEAARAGGDFTKTLSDLKNKETIAAVKCDQQIAALPLFSGDKDDLLRLRLPLSETIAAYKEELDGLRARLRRAQEHTENAHTDMNARDSDAKSHGRQHVGTADALAEARRERDNLFDHLVNLWRAGPPSSVPTDVYTGSVRRADSIADERFAAADAISRAEAALERLNRAREDLSSRERAQALAAEAFADGVRRWSELWIGLSSEPLTPGEMAEWCRKVEDIRTAAEESRRLRSDVADAERNRAHHVDVLREALHKAGKAPVSFDLSVLIRIASEHSKSIHETALRIGQLARERRAGEAAASKYIADVEHQSRRLAEWHTRWGEATARLHLSTDLAPEDVNEVTNEIRTMFGALDQAQGFRARIRGIERDRDSYCKIARALIEEFSADLLPAFDISFADAIKELTRRLDIEERRASAAIVREQNRARLSEAIGRRIQELEEQNAIRDAAVKEHKLELADLDKAIARSKLVHDLAEKLDGLERDVHLSTGLRLAEIDAEIEARGEDALRSDLIACEDALRQENETRDRLLELGQAIREKIQAIEGSTAAADHQGEMLAVGTIIDREARRYASLLTASALLRNEVERYANAHQGPIIEAASLAFALITGGRYHKIRVIGREAEQAVLEAVCDDGTECSLSGLSDGTRDQLYLALRLATLTEYLKTAPVTLPVMIDDALVNFDDERTASAFRALYAFSSRAQVIYFTHHESVVTIAERTLEDKVDVIRLPGIGESISFVPGGDAV
jgi:uncharacterized protein YhaN